MKTRKRRELPPAESRQWRTVDEAAAFLGCSKSTVQRLSSYMIAGVPRLPSVPRGSRARIWHIDAVEAWLAARQAE